MFRWVAPRWKSCTCEKGRGGKHERWELRESRVRRWGCGRQKIRSRIMLSLPQMLLLLSMLSTLALGVAGEKSTTPAPTCDGGTSPFCTVSLTSIPPHTCAPFRQDWAQSTYFYTQHRLIHFLYSLYYIECIIYS